MRASKIDRLVKMVNQISLNMSSNAPREILVASDEKLGQRLCG